MSLSPTLTPVIWLSDGQSLRIRCNVCGTLHVTTSLRPAAGGYASSRAGAPEINNENLVVGDDQQLPIAFPLTAAARPRASTSRLGLL